MNLRRTGILGSFVVTALVMAACTSDGGDNGAATDQDPSSTTIDGGATSAPSSSSTLSSAPVSTPASSAAPLAASFRGVTADTITVGFVAIDYERLNADFGLGLTNPDEGPIMQVLIDDLNDRGGINGRSVELITVPFLPVGTATAEEACIRLVEDEQVFAVLGGFAGPGTEASNLCFSGSGETILIGGPLTDERVAQSTVPWVTAEMGAGRRGEAMVRALAESGQLADLGTIAVHAVSPEQDATAIAVEQALLDAGADVALRTTGESSGDQAATAVDTEVMLERARSEGVASIVVVGVSPAITDTIFDADEFTVVLPRTEELDNLDNATLDDGDRLIGTGSVIDLDDAAAAECIEFVEAALAPDGVLPLDETADDLSYWTSTLRACRNLTLFEQLATAAGPDLTNDTMREALATVELPALPLYPFASLGPDKWDANDTLSVLEFDHAQGHFVPVAGPFDVGG